MFKYALLAASAALALTATASVTSAHTSRGVVGKHYHPRAAKVRYGGRPNVGYWRPGPAQGPGFGFSTYRGDPFGSDDYYDGDRCYYVRHQNFCEANHIFNGFD